MVPETLLKKRKSQEKAREEKSAEIKKRKDVRISFGLIPQCGDGDDTLINTRLDLRVDVVHC